MAVQGDKKAWDHYLATTRDLHGEEYDKVEPFAWAQLRAKLNKLKPKRTKVA